MVQKTAGLRRVAPAVSEINLQNISALVKQYQEKIRKLEGEGVAYGSLFSDTSGSGYQHWRYQEGGKRKYVSKKLYKELAPQVARGQEVKSLRRECLEQIEGLIQAIKISGLI